MASYEINEMNVLALKNWFLTEQRDLPWRRTQDPYAIWISEIMLQQTQVVVVIPYFLSWMERYPTIYHLAQASVDEVLKSWEGLGYYSRARHIHEAAKDLVANFNGQLPSEEEKLKKIKGLGPYTVGAILSFAFHQKKAAVDGNVVRVLARYFGIEDDISKTSTLKQIRQIAENLLPEEEPWVINEALIELGATVCQRNPHCGKCPLNRSCHSFKNNMAKHIPRNSKKVKIEQLFRAVAVIQCGSNLLVKRGVKGEIMRDLYEFPYFEITQKEFSPNFLQKIIEETFSLEVEAIHQLKEVSHGFTRYQVKLFPALFSCDRPKEIQGMEWLSLQSLKQLAFSSGHLRIYQQLGHGFGDLLQPI